MIRRSCIIAALACAAALPAATATSQRFDQGARPRAEPLAINEGRFLAFGGLYGNVRIGCVQCHELDGSGNSSGAFPRLTDQLGWYLYKSLRDYASGLRPNAIMGPIASALTDRQMQDLAAYYASLKDAPYPAEPQFDVQVLQIGGAIAAVGIPDQGVPACNGCHGRDGVGQAPIYPYLAGQFAPYLRHQLVLWKQGRRQGDPMNIMAMIAKAMTLEQIAAVSAYYESVRPRELTPADPLAAAGAPFTTGQTAPTGAVAAPQPGGPGVAPGAEPAAPPAPRVDYPIGLPRRPLPPNALPPYLSPPTTGEGLDSTTTATGQQNQNPR